MPMSDDIEKLMYDQFSEYIKSIPRIATGIETLHQALNQTNKHLDVLTMSIGSMDSRLQAHTLEDIRIQTSIDTRLAAVEDFKALGHNVRPQYYAVLVAIFGIIISVGTAIATIVVPLLSKKP